MKARPIIFSAPMIRALLAGTKTQTRRVARLTDAGHLKEPGGNRRWHPGDAEAIAACPYGRPGDLLWVRETWHTSPHFDCLYRANYDDDAHLPKVVAHGGWRSPIFMPRRLSRLTLCLTGVRVQRVQEISEEGARAEGCAPYRLPVHPARESLRYTDGFAQLWDSINGKKPGCSWDANPWVFALTFEPIPRNVDEVLA